jgi:hypothetical protein
MPKFYVPWRYIVMLAVGLAVLVALLARFGRSAPILIGWLIAWLFISRGVEFLIRQRRRPPREDRD